MEQLYYRQNLADKPRKPGSGGARPGAGRKTPNKIEGEVKHNVSVKVYPTQEANIIKKYGSVQKGVDSL